MALHLAPIMDDTPSEGDDSGEEPRRPKPIAIANDDATEAPVRPDFFDSPFTELDSRFIVGPSDWHDYLVDLDRIKRAPHRFSDPCEYPLYVTTAWLAGTWTHQIVDVRWLDYMAALRAERPWRPTTQPGSYARPARVRRRGAFDDVDG